MKQIIIISLIAILMLLNAGSSRGGYIGARYTIDYSTLWEYPYEVYSNNGMVLLSGVKYGAEPRIECVKGDVWSVWIGVGTGYWLTRYIDMANRLVSEWFENLFAADDEKVAYFEYDEDIQIRLVIQKIFESARQVYYRDFAQYITLAGIDNYAEWLDNGDYLHMEYTDVSGNIVSEVFEYRL
jgi:pimeloyl-ACP methyl ester carboxylesterase